MCQVHWVYCDSLSCIKKWKFGTNPRRPCTIRPKSWRRAISVPPVRRHRFGAGQLGAMSFQRRTFQRRFLIYFYFSSNEEKTMKQAISWMPLSANLLKLESSILPRVKRTTNRNNVATEKRIQQKKVLAPNRYFAGRNVRRRNVRRRNDRHQNVKRRNVPDPFSHIGTSKTNQKRFFLQNDWVLPTLETLGVKTVYFKELVMKFKVVYNVVSGNFYFDQNNVRCHWK